MNQLPGDLKVEQFYTLGSPTAGADTESSMRVMVPTRSFYTAREGQKISPERHLENQGRFMVHS